MCTTPNPSNDGGFSASKGTNPPLERPERVQTLDRATVVACIESLEGCGYRDPLGRPAEARLAVVLLGAREPGDIGLSIAEPLTATPASRRLPHMPIHITISISDPTLSEAEAKILAHRLHGYAADAIHDLDPNADSEPDIDVQVRRS